MSDVLKVPALVDASGEVAKFPSDTLVLTHRGKQLDPIMEELVRPGGYSLTYGGVVRLTRVDLLEIKQSFSYYYCEACTNTPTGITGWLNVSYVTELYMILVFTEVATKNVYRRHKINGVWDDWKLEFGEVELWKGDASTDSTLTLSQNINRFKSLVITVAGCSIICPFLGGSTLPFGNVAFSSSESMLNLDSGVLEFSGNNACKVASMKRICFLNGLMSSESVTIQKIIGRP